MFYNYNKYILSIYNTEDWEILEEKIKEIVEDHKGDCLMIGGDFNTRIREDNGNEEEDWCTKRNSKDKIINSKGRKLLDLIREIGGIIANGATKGDENGEFTHKQKRLFGN